jgi:hypothetical protein
MTEEPRGSTGPATDRHNEPVIDPTKNVLDLVTAAIQRQDDLRQAESSHMRDLLALRAEFAKELRSAEDRRQETVNQEKFASVETQLALVERQRVEQKADTKAAVDAALAAAKEAVKEQTTASQLSIGKSEASTKEQLNQLSATFSTAQAGMNAAIINLTTRVERIENARTAVVEQKVDNRGTVGMIVGAFGILIAIIGLASRFLGGG